MGVDVDMDMEVAVGVDGRRRDLTGAWSALSSGHALPYLVPTYLGHSLTIHSYLVQSIHCAVRGRGEQ